MSKEEIVLLYIHDFKYNTKEASDKLSAHPKSGRVYRAIKDIEEEIYRVFTTNKVEPTGIQGILLRELKGESKMWKVDAEEINDENILSLDIVPADQKKILKWEKEDHKELKQFLNNEEYGLQKVEEVDSGEEIDSEIDMDYEEHEDHLVDALNKSLEGDPNLHFSLIEVLYYISETYGEKYSKAVIDPKPFYYSKEYGKGFNIGNALKYLSRYSTEGFDKSDNPKDLLKAIHYLLFELTRRNING